MQKEKSYLIGWSDGIGSEQMKEINHTHHLHSRSSLGKIQAETVVASAHFIRRNRRLATPFKVLPAPCLKNYQ